MNLTIIKKVRGRKLRLIIKMLVHLRDLVKIMMLRANVKENWLNQ
jgi:hypothetical protein